MIRSSPSGSTRDVLGLAVYRGFPVRAGVLSQQRKRPGSGSDGPASEVEGSRAVAGCRDVEAEHNRLAALGVPVLRAASWSRGG